MKTLAIDFGTSHSYFTICASDSIKPESVSFGTSYGLETAVLYPKEGDALIGDEAFEEYGMILPQDRKNYEIHLQFKPEVHKSEQAARDAYCFLSTVLKKRADLLLDVEKVLIGIPCEATFELSSKIVEIAKEAGYGPNVSTVEEPKGALLHHVAIGDIHPEEALDGTLIIDFGGGTCDFAYMYNGQPVHVWGDMEYGGRIFDDLFFQWFAEQNPRAFKKIVNDNQQNFVLFYECRKAKEHFSETMKQRNKAGEASTRITDYGFIRNMTWDEFIERCRNYSPSDTFREWIKQTGSCQNLLRKSNQPTDLVEYFRTLFLNGIAEYRLRGTVKQVILAGGSSLWLWVGEMVSEELGIDLSVIRQSNNPYAVISQGLSVLPALQLKAERTKEEVRKTFPTLIDDEIMPLLDAYFKKTSDRIATSASIELYERIYPLFEDVRKEGGTIKSLKENISEKIRNYEQKFKKFVEEELGSANRVLASRIADVFSQWFKRHDLFVPRVRMNLTASGDRIGETKINIDTMIGEAIKVATIGLVAAVTGTVCGGAGTALIVSGPVGWILGSAGILAASALSPRFLGWAKGKMPKEIEGLFEKTPEGVKELLENTSQKIRGLPEEAISNINIPSKALGISVSARVLPEKKIRKFQEKLKAHLSKTIYRELDNQSSKLREEILRRAQVMIEALSEINNVDIDRGQIYA